MKIFALTVSALVLTAPFAFGQTNMVDVANPDAVKWQTGPAALPKGAESSLLSGDMKTGPWVTRLKFPAGYVIPPHTHTNIENVTVLSGDLHIGMGSKFDKANTKVIDAGGYFMMPPGMQHFAYSEKGAVLQVHSNTESTITYVDPQDDPRKK